MARVQVVDDVVHRQPGVDDVLDEEHVLAVDRLGQVGGDLHDARRLGLVAVALHAQELDAHFDLDGIARARSARNTKLPLSTPTSTSSLPA